jgi:hypothetical protein
MQRQKVEASTQPSYPSRQGFRVRRAGLACAGMLLIMIGAPGCPGDVAVPIDGDVAVPRESFFVALPREGSRTVRFDERGGWMDYHLELTVDNRDLADFLAYNAQDLLDEVQQLLEGQVPRSFEDGDEIARIEQRLQQLLADAWTGTPEAPTWNFIECILVVDEIVREELIDGDMPEPAE